MSATDRWQWPVILNLGMGVDSVALLTRWIHEPDTRNFDLRQLVVVTAMTGDEHADTAEAMTSHILPILRAHRLRYVQLARAGESLRDGITVLDDSRHPTTMHMRGPWALSDELTLSGTLPPTARRVCSQKYKGKVIDTWVADELADTPYLQVKGYRVDEQDRIDKDTHPTVPNRYRDYPLSRWRWTRPHAAAYLQKRYQRRWPRSCCTYCPFQASRAGVAELVARWAAFPEGAVQALTLERVALALNERQLLFRRRSAHQLVAQHPELAHVAAAYTETIDAMPWAVYEVRRIFQAAHDDPDRKGNAWRSTDHLYTGDRHDVHDVLHDLADTAGIPVTIDDHGIPRIWHRKLTEVQYPDVEHFLTTAPAAARRKERKRFAATWAAA